MNSGRSTTRWPCCVPNLVEQAGTDILDQVGGTCRRVANGYDGDRLRHRPGRRGPGPGGCARSPRPSACCSRWEERHVADVRIALHGPLKFIVVFPSRGDVPPGAWSGRFDRRAGEPKAVDGPLRTWLGWLDRSAGHRTGVLLRGGCVLLGAQALVANSAMGAGHRQQPDLAPPIQKLGVRNRSRFSLRPAPRLRTQPHPIMLKLLHRFSEVVLSRRDAPGCRVI